MVVVVTEVAKQHVQAFGFGDEDGGVQDFTNGKTFFVVVQEVFGMEDADDFVRFAFYCRIAGMTIFDYVADPFIDGARNVNDVHLGKGHHDVTYG